MKLRDYLWNYGFSIKEFAGKTLYSPDYVSAIMNGKKEPSRKFERDVFNVTDGKVGPDEIVCKREHLEKKIDEISQLSFG